MTEVKRNIGNKIRSVDTFSYSILLSTNIIIFFVGIIATGLNILNNLDGILNVLTLTFSSVASISYYLLKKYDLFRSIRLFTTIWLYILINITWYFNFGSSGPILGMYIAYAVFVAFIWPTRTSAVIGILVLVNIIILFSIEYNYGEYMLQYASESERITDVYFGTMVTFFLIFGFSIYARYQYFSKYLEAKQADAIKTTFLQNMSHELRTPLNAIIGFTELMNENMTKSEMLEYIRIVNSSGNHLLGLVEDLMDVTMIESEQINIEKEAIDFNSLVKETMDLFEIELERSKKPIMLKRTMLDSLNGFEVVTDSKRYKQLLLNLLKNALKFSEKGDIHVRFTVEYGANQPMIKGLVEDNGVGIPADMKESIFEKFKQVEREGSDVNEGVGLGLAISRSISKLLGGNLWVESIEGAGSQFYFTIPIHQIA